MQELSTAELARAAITKSNRRRSLKTLFQLPLPGRTTSYVPLETTATIGNVPTDIVREIVDFLSPNEILNFSLTSSKLRLLLLPALYDTVILKSSRSCRITLRMLDQKRHLCHYIRKLAVRPNYYLSWPQVDAFVDESWVVDMLVSIAPDLKLMSTFDWDGLELPCDRLWKTLRLKCPSLKSVFTNVGKKPLDPESDLFKFEDLKSFSLIVRHGLPGSDLFPTLELLPDQFWDMLLLRSPHLEELAICSFSASSRIFDFERINEGCWPALNSLTLGSFGYQSDFSLGPSTMTNDSDRSLSQFIDKHTSLKYIRFLWNFKRWMSPDTIPLSLSPTALPMLETFIGVYQQLSKLPRPESIETVDLTCEPIYESRLNSVCPILRTLTNLTSLDIWIHLFDTIRDHTHYFNSIISSCPKLTDLHFMCTTSFSVKPLKQLIDQFHLLPDLKRFSLTKGHKYLDESMLETATRILKGCPTLKQINVRWARETCPNHLKQEGSYDVLCDGDGRPNALMVVERGIPLVGSPFRRRYRHNINLDVTPEWQRSVGRTTKVVRRRMSSMFSV